MKKKILTILGTRPEIIRLSIILPLLDKYSNHTIVHTGQNYDYNLDKIFYNEINNYNLNLNYNFFKKYYLLKLIFLNNLFFVAN